MGFLDDLGVSRDQVVDPGRKLAPEGKWEFEIGAAKRQKGTKNRPQEEAVIFTYQLSDADGDPKGSVEERWVVKEGGKVTQLVLEKLGFLDLRLKTLGFEGGIEDPEFTSVDDVVGIRGTLEIVHKVSGDRKFANVRNVEAFGGAAEEDDSNEFADPVPEDIAAPTKAQAARKPRGKQAQESPAADNEDLWSTD